MVCIFTRITAFCFGLYSVTAWSFQIGGNNRALRQYQRHPLPVIHSCVSRNCPTGGRRIPFLEAANGEHHEDSISSFLSESFRRAVVVARNEDGNGEQKEEIQKTLVKMGLEYDKHHQQLLGANLDEIEGILVSPLIRVPGCIATVHIRSILIPVKTNSDIDTTIPTKMYKLWLDGDADALLSRGLLAILSKALFGSDQYFSGRKNRDETENYVSVEDVLQINPDSVAKMLQLRHFLSQGRNDGLASMMTVIQSQIRGLLPEKDETLINPFIVQDVVSQNGENTNSDERSAPTVAMLLSGGVDSSVALNLLKRQGYSVTAFYLKIWLEDEVAHLGQCPWEDDYRVCQDVCAQAGVPLETVSLQKEYKESVISYTVHEAERGRTPNPDIMCNSRVKFGCFYDAIEGRGFDFVASGHYAQLVNDTDTEGQRRLLRAPDPVKDQSYFLCALTQTQLKRILFPIGHLQKSEVRELAEEFDLPNKKRPDSQGLCFLGKVKFDEFLAAYLGTRPGDIVDASTGDILGKHNGVWYHTVGQRKGLGKVLNPLATSRGPWYIVAKDPQRDIVFASNQYDEEVFTAARSDFYVEDIRWIAGTPPTSSMQRIETGWKGRFSMKIRHGPRIVEGTLDLTGDDSGNVRLDNKDGGLAPGQFVVFYTLDDNECLGSGVISERHWAKFLLDNSEVVGATTQSA